MSGIIFGILIFVLGLILGIILTYLVLKERAKTWFEDWKNKYEDKLRKDALDRSRAALKGKVGEQIAPLLPIFEHEPSDARFLGSPVDYVIFEGDSEKEPESITFADVKTGKSARLTQKQKKIKEIIEQGKVNWETIRLDFED